MAEGSIRFESHDADRSASGLWWTVALAVLTFAGLILRIAAARGDFWLDEIWTYRLVETVPSVWSVFVALPYDNNHPLNSAWLALLGAGASPLAARSLSIVLGTLCIPVAAKLGARRSPFVGLCAAALVAFDGLFIHFASEARGYAGMMLAVLVAMDRLEAVLDTPGRRAPLVVFGVAVAFGTLSHATMIVASGLLAASAAGRTLADQGWTWKSADRIATIGLTIVCATLPAAICALFSVSSGPLHTGTISPFSWPMFVRGTGRMAASTLGLPDGEPPPAVALCLFVGLAAAGLALVPGRQRIFPALAIFGVSALQVAFRVPNEEYARFHLLAGLGLIILAVDVIARARRATGPVHAAVFGVVLLAGAGQAWTLTQFLQYGRGEIAGPVAAMTAEGPADVMVRPASLFGETGAVIDWYARRLSVRLRSVPPGCGLSAPWLLVVREPDDVSEIPRVAVPLAGCREPFSLGHAYPAYGLSGFTWLVYRRVDRAADRD